MTGRGFFGFAYDTTTSVTSAVNRATQDNTLTYAPDPTGSPGQFWVGESPRDWASASPMNGGISFVSFSTIRMTALQMQAFSQLYRSTLGQNLSLP